MDQESVEKYAIDTSMERMELQNPPILDDKGTSKCPEIWGSMTNSVAYTNLPPSPPSEESFEFPFVACNAQIAQEQDLLNFQVQGNFRFYLIINDLFVTSKTKQLFTNLKCCRKAREPFKTLFNDILFLISYF